MAQQFGRTPPNRQIAADIRGQIERGELRPNDALPSIVTLAERYQVSTKTVQKALGILKREGLIEGEPGYGTFVVDPSAAR
jgi:DNA-binding GntR family transcriptional regulator